ncbi:MAG: hypothetical protein J6A60_01375 [Clostridia bacterium]|nr:hypothetical protein [Clostridia bacterium]
MKKTLALLLAIVISAVAICTLTVSAFAENGNNETPAPDAGAADSADMNEDADADKNEAADADKEENKEEDKKEEETKATEAATLPGVQLPDALKPTQPTTAPATKAEDATKETEKATDPTKAPETSLAGTEVVTLPEGVTSIDDGPATTKAPAKVDNVIPDTGSGVVVPAVALLVLAAGTVAVVKTKKD